MFLRLKTYHYTALKSILIAMTASGLIGMGVAYPFVLNHSDNLPSALAKSFLVAVLIAAVVSGMFIFSFRILRHRTFWAFAATALIIGTGTPLGAYILDFRHPIPLLLMTLLAETAGMALTLIMYRYTLRLNEKLAETQAKFKTTGGSP